MTVLQAIPYIPNTAQAQILVRKRPDARTDYYRSAKTIVHVGLEGSSRIETTSLISVERKVSGNEAAYRISAENGLRVGTTDGRMVGYKDSKKKVKRNLRAQEVTTAEKGLALSAHIINSTIGQLKRKPRRSGIKKETIKLDITNLLPGKIVLSVGVQPIEVPGGAEDALLIVIQSEPLEINSAVEGMEDKPISGLYRGVLVYSPSEDRLYQDASTYDAEFQEEKVRIERMQFASDEKGEKPVYPLLDVSEALEFSEEIEKHDSDMRPSLWVAQAIRAYEVVETVAVTTAEKATNPGPVISMAEIYLRAYANLSRQMGSGTSRAFLKALGELNERFAEVIRQAGGDVANPYFVKFLEDYGFFKPVYVGSLPSLQFYTFFANRQRLLFNQSPPFARLPMSFLNFKAGVWPTEVTPTEIVPTEVRSWMDTPEVKSAAESPSPSAEAPASGGISTGWLLGGIGLGVAGIGAYLYGASQREKEEEAANKCHCNGTYYFPNNNKCCSKSRYCSSNGLCYGIESFFGGANPCPGGNANIEIWSGGC